MRASGRQLRRGASAIDTSLSQPDMSANTRRAYATTLRVVEREVVGRHISCAGRGSYDRAGRLTISREASTDGATSVVGQRQVDGLAGMTVLAPATSTHSHATRLGSGISRGPVRGKPTCSSQAAEPAGRARGQSRRCR